MGLINDNHHTEIGVIPEDWQLLELREVCDRIGVGLATSVTKYYRDHGVPIIRNLNIKDGRFDGSDMLFLDEEFAKANKGKAAKALDVLTVHTGSNLGLSCVLPVEYSNCQTFTTLITTPKKGLLDPFYLSTHMGSAAGRKEMERLEVGGGKGNLNTSDLKQYKITVPPIEEQRAIATALSDVDALIASLDKLIAKKRAIKTAAMQQLLTGKKRLPGFGGEWEVKRLGDVLVYEQPTKYLVSNSEYSDANDVPVLTAGKTFILGYTSENDGVYDNLPVIIFDDFTTANKYVTFPFKAKSSAMKLLRPRNQSVNLRLVYEMMQLIEFKLGDHKRYWISEYQKLEVRIPGADEQVAIATILSDMDTEIIALEARRDKTRAIKQGMMQELLTGRTRLI